MESQLPPVHVALGESLCRSRPVSLPINGKNKFCPPQGLLRGSSKMMCFKGLSTEGWLRAWSPGFLKNVQMSWAEQLGCA